VVAAVDAVDGIAVVQFKVFPVAWLGLKQERQRKEADEPEEFHPENFIKTNIRPELQLKSFKKIPI
jgi:hypothetical protein